MSDDFKTLREVGIAIGGVQKQFSWHTGVFAGSVVVAVAATGFLYNKLDKVADSTARIETRLTNIEMLLSEIRTNTRKTVGDLGDIKDAIKIAASPKPDAFQGFVGAKLGKPENLKDWLLSAPDKANIWIYSDDKSFIKAIPDK